MNRIIWTNGVFDLLHPGHIELLKVARSLGDKLIVGLDMDERVSAMKGPDRPINSWTDRKTVLESIRYVDLVVGFNSDEEIGELLNLFKPAVVIDNPNWSDLKTPYLPKGIEVRKLGLIGNYSSTGIINRIRSS